MDDREFWGTSGYEDEGEDVFPDMGAVVEIEFDHALDDTPVATAQLYRYSIGYAERMTISGYPKVRTIFVTCPRAWSEADHVYMPGVVREIPVGWRDLASEATFLARFEKIVESYESHGWVRAPEEATC